MSDNGIFSEFSGIYDNCRKKFLSLKGYQLAPTGRSELVRDDARVERATLPPYQQLWLSCVTPIL